MSFQLKPRESISSGIKRIAGKEIHSAINHLRDFDNLDTGIHEARKSFKKLRAIALMVRSEIGAKAYKSANVTFRDAGRCLAPARDGRVLVLTLDRLRSDVDPWTFNEIHHRFLVREESIFLWITALRNPTIADVIEMVEEGGEQIAAWRIEDDSFDVFRSNIRRVYRRGQRALARAKKAPTPENFHEWRREVKYLWYHMRILRRMWPEMMGELNAQLERLADELGDAHDFVVLQAVLKDCADIDAAQSVIEIARLRQSELESRVIPSGERLYAEAPGQFLDRLESYWEIWREYEG